MNTFFSMHNNTYVTYYDYNMSIKHYRNNNREKESNSLIIILLNNTFNNKLNLNINYFVISNFINVIFF